MLRVVLFAITVALAVSSLPSLALAGRDHPDCKRITKQITRYEGVVEMAEDRGNELWAKATQDHVTRLELRRANECPQYAEELRERSRMRWLAYETNRAFKSAAKGFMQYMSMGAY